MTNEDSAATGVWRWTGPLVVLAFVAGLVLLARTPPGPGGLRAPLLPDLGAEPTRPDVRPAPDFTLPALDGSVWSLAEHRGEVVLLNFWATWCAPCLEELPALETLHRVLAGEGLQLLAISLDGSRDTLERYLADRGLSLRVLHDPEEAVARRYGVAGYPTTVVIDARGRVVVQEVGAWDWSDPSAVAWLRALLRGAPQAAAPATP